MISIQLFTYLLGPIVIANIIHIYAVKKNTLPLLQIPISKKLFGKNKTLRAFLILPMFTAIIQWLLSLFIQPSISISPSLLGFSIGMVYLVAELPNSFIKRRLKIAPGEARSTWNLWFDKSDSPLAICGFLYFTEILSFRSALYFFISCLAINFLMSLILVKTNVKEGL